MKDKTESRGQLQQLLFESQTIDEAFRDFLIAKRADGASPKTIASYESHFHSICRYLDGSLPIINVTNQLLRRMVARMAESDLSPNSIRSYTATMKSFLSWCDAEDIAHLSMKLYKGVDTAKETYTTEELQKLLAPPDLKRCTFAEYRAWVIVNLLVNNGLRAGSIRAIKNKDVDLDSSIITLRHTKTRKVQVIPLSSSMVVILRRYMSIRKGDENDALFCELSGEPMSETALSDAIERYNHRRGVKKTGIHRFRHTFAKLYITEIGGNALKLQKLLGHSTLDMTKHYVNLYDTDIMQGYDAESPLELLKSKQRKERIKMR
jgi:integrase/recombinase XerD